MPSQPAVASLSLGDSMLLVSTGHMSYHLATGMYAFISFSVVRMSLSHSQQWERLAGCEKHAAFRSVSV